jgi:hypothetical protein
MYFRMVSNKLFSEEPNKIALRQDRILLREHFSAYDPTADSTSLYV